MIKVKIDVFFFVVLIKNPFIKPSSNPPVGVIHEHLHRKGCVASRGWSDTMESEGA